MHLPGWSPSPAAPSPRRARSASSNGRRGRPKGSGTRALQALELVRARPGITIPELAEAMNIKQNYLYRVMPTLAEEGKVVKSGRGWHTRDGDEQRLPDSRTRDVTSHKPELLHRLALADELLDRLVDPLPVRTPARRGPGRSRTRRPSSGRGTRR